MNVKDIVIDYLKKNGCQGLCFENCGCDINDLASSCFIGGDFLNCEPAVRFCGVPESERDECNEGDDSKCADCDEVSYIKKEIENG